MKKKTVIALAFLFSGMLFGLLVRVEIEKVREKKQVKIELVKKEQKAVNDSIVLLNRLLIQENQRYISVIVALDSISRKGGILPFTNFKGKTFELKLIAK